MVIALDSPVNASSTSAHVQLLPVFGHQGSASQHSYTGLDSSLFCGTGKSGWAFPASPSAQTSFTPLCKAEMGKISNEDESDFALVEVHV